MLDKTPVFHFNEVVVQLPQNQLKLTQQNTEKEVVATVIHTGETVQKYKAGDTVLFSKQKANQLEKFGEEVWLVPTEHFIICSLEG